MITEIDNFNYPCKKKVIVENCWHCILHIGAGTKKLNLVEGHKNKIAMNFIGFVSRELKV